MTIYRLLSLSPSGDPKSDCRSGPLIDVTAKSLSIDSRDTALDYYNQITERNGRSKRYTRTKGGLTEDQEGGVCRGCATTSAGKQVIGQKARKRRMAAMVRYTGVRKW